MQVIDDEAQKTLVSLGTQSQEVKAVVGTEEWKTSPKKFQSGAQDIDYNLIVANLV